MIDKKEALSKMVSISTLIKIVSIERYQEKNYG